MSLPEVLIALAGILVAALALFYGWLALAHRRRRRFYRRANARGALLGPRARLLYDLRSVGALLTAAWWQVRARPLHGTLAPRGRPTGPPVLCVHGYLLNATSTWGLRRALADAGRPSQAVSLGRPVRPLEGYAGALERALDRLRRDFPGEPFDVVAHSMGGLVLRVVLARRADLAAAARRIVTLGTPHRGSAMIDGWRLHTGPEVRQMGAESEFLRNLPGFHGAAPQAEVTTVAAAYDLVVYPAECAYLPACRHLELEGVTHLGLVTQRRALRAVVEILCRGDRPEGA